MLTQDDISRLLRACGQALASELLLGAQIWSAERALSTGLVNQLFTNSAFAAGSESLIAAICANSRDANCALKRGIATALQPSPDALKAATQDFEKLFASPDFIEGRDAFLQKRPAKFPSHN